MRTINLKSGITVLGLVVSLHFLLGSPILSMANAAETVKKQSADTNKQESKSDEHLSESETSPDKSVKIEKRSAYVWYGIGLEAIQNGDHVGAYNAFVKVMRLHRNAISVGNAARAAEDAKYYDEAEKLYKQAIEMDPKDAANLGNYAIFLTNVRGKHDEAEELYKQVIEITPKNANYLGIYAHFLTSVRGKHNEAEKLYQQAIEVDPKNAYNLGNYAYLLANVRGKHDEAEKLYKQVIEITPKNANYLGFYAYFLTSVRGKHNEAEKLYKQAIEADPKIVANLDNYAYFLTNVRGKHDEAERLYQRVIEIDPKNANSLGNYAKLLLALGRKEGKSMLNRAFAANPTIPGLQCELWFYRWAHFPHKYPEALDKLKALLESGARSKGWNLSPNIERAQSNGHPNVPLLYALADVITKDAPIKNLEAFEEWKKLK